MTNGEDRILDEIASELADQAVRDWKDASEREAAKDVCPCHRREDTHALAHRALVQSGIIPQETSWVLVTGKPGKPNMELRVTGHGAGQLMLAIKAAELLDAKEQGRAR